MKTSPTQFEMMVDFMEKQGDLSKPSQGANGRVTNIKHWADLTEMLNGDPTGDAKTLEKWRKVWSDFKNNMKRKAARASQAAGGTGGGPASKIKLSDLEQRVLSIIGTQAATLLVNIPEVGLYDEEMPVYLEMPSTSESSQDQRLIPSTIATSGLAEEPELAASLDLLHEEAQNEFSNPISPVPATPPVPASPRRRRRLHRVNPVSSPVRRSRPHTQSELARQCFANSDMQWRAFQREKAREANELERERLRLRQIELDQQRRWQDLFGECLLILKKGLDIYEKKNCKLTVQFSFKVWFVLLFLSL